MPQQEVIIRIITLIVFIFLFPLGIFLIFHFKDKYNNRLNENEKSERKKLNDKKKNK
jgi:phosphotransferase system  glucose/maltose/N-acetylglucosamine-specific IIC component